MYQIFDFIYKKNIIKKFFKNNIKKNFMNIIKINNNMLKTK